MSNVKEFARDWTTTERAERRVHESLDLFELKRSQLTDFPDDDHTDLLSRIGRASLRLACFKSVLNPDDQSIATHLTWAAQAYTAICRLGMYDRGETLEVAAGSGLVKLNGTGVTSMTDADNWRTAYFLATICRADYLLDFLCEIPIARVRESSTKSDDYAYQFIEALEANHYSDDRTAVLALEAIAAAQQPRIASEDYATAVPLPQIDLLYIVTQRDSAEFNEHLKTALSVHRLYWRQKTHTADISGYLALGLLAMCSLARDAGMEVEYEADYCPRWIYEGGSAHVFAKDAQGIDIGREV